MEKILCKSCRSTQIQNKKKQLCSECVFKLNHEGKSRQEVYSERSKSKVIGFKSKKEYSDFCKKQDKYNDKLNKISNIKNLKNLEDLENPKTLDMIDKMELQDMFLKNIQNQNKAEQEAKEEISFRKRFKNSKLFKLKPGKSYKIKKTKNQHEIDIRYRLACIEMDYIEEKVCTGCLRYQGGDIKLSHSHIISREDCKRIGKPELIYDRDNITYHCMDFGENEGCHRKHESKNYTIMSKLCDFSKNIEFIKLNNIDLYNKITYGK